MSVWRFIDTGLSSASFNMSLDEAMAIAVRRDKAPPTLRIYGWTGPSVSIGCFQRIRDVDIEYCSKNDIPIVRRPTGGRAIFHRHDITYSFSAKTTSGIFSKGLLDSYKKIGTALFLAFTKIGTSPELKLLREMRRSSSGTDYHRNPFCFRSVSFGEITVNGKKIVGSAQKRWTGCLLQQGSIPFLIDRNEIVKIFRLDPLQETGEPMIGLKEVSPEVNHEKFKDVIRISFEEIFDKRFILSPPLEEEISCARELEAGKYLSHEWTFRR
jgi:lipoate-protein ligase A